MGNKTHVITWVSLIFIILTFLFFIASVFVLEFAVGIGSDGDIIIPWYYWFFFVGAGVFLTIFVILMAIPVPYDMTVIATQGDKMEINQTYDIPKTYRVDRGDNLRLLARRM